MSARDREHVQAVHGPGCMCIHHQHERAVAAAKVQAATSEPAPKLARPQREVAAPSEALKPQKAGASIPVLAQASKTTAPRGRGVGRRFTKATAAGAAVARAQRLAPEQRQDIARRAASARWGGSKAGS